jgi:hypothetical protein
MANSDRTLEEPTIKESIVKLQEIQRGHLHNLFNLHLKLEMLDSNPELQINLENFKVDVESRASDLQAEVERL